MASQEKFSLIRGILLTLGLPKNAVEDIIERISDWLAEKEDDKSTAKIQYPYLIRDDFLSPAELSFYLVLKLAVADWAIISTKVSLGDLFYARSKDSSEYRIATNKIDRKHVDFLLCDPRTMRPMLGIELDDKSHLRSDRQERDVFVGKVFEAAGLPLARIPVRPAYSVQQINTFLRQCTASKETVVVQPEVNPAKNGAPDCPKCGMPMVLRVVKKGTNPGDKFWGCSNYPKCRGIIQNSE
jgi:hypothetical protein